MVFPVIGGDGKPTGYDIDNSLRFNEADDSKLVFDPADDDNKRTFTFSFWMKPAVGDYGGDHNNVFSVRPSAGSYNMLVHRTGGEFLIEMNGTGDVLKTNRLFRDPSAWYHIVMAIDTTDGTASNRVKFYVNGTEETSFATDNRSNLSQNTDMLWGGAQPHQISGDPTGNYFYGGYLAEIHFVTGSQLAPSSFGETNDNGVWIPKKFAGSHGTNGFFLEFKQTGTSANASGIGADTSGGTNHFTPTNLAATDVTVDTPTNNFCTLNPLHKSTSNVLLSEGNLKAVLNQTSGWQHAAGTMAVKNGKWYWEAKALNVAATDKTSIGVVEFETDGVNFINNTNKDIINGNTAGITGHGAGVGSYSYAEGDIINVAMDMDNNKIYYGKNGTYFGNLNPASGSGSTTQTVNNSRFSVPVVGGYADSSWEMNFGVPQFSISSGNSDADGFGNFEFAVPSGFFALCTKNLAEYG